MRRANNDEIIRLQFVGVEGFVTAIVDLFPQHLRRGYRKELFIGLCCTLWFLVGLSMVTEVRTKRNYQHVTSI